ncbi:DUF4959 domain-containing protein [Fulvivirgaceae bacterium BMA10]|uniref:DUF4959 domain-containing protein n=1 Tax=Splendidivirga corallicola TaxID=3051826 RepID=A0ABT8KQ06_9BACT|nr:DUF4959 domain-containing protein [Fulvivirgaceae bacterium BMA10]
MKNVYIKSLVLFVTVYMISTSCKDDESGPFFNDGTIPPQVTEVEVENLPGGARISYTVPDVQDILYVEAEFKRDNGKTVTARSSVFKNFVEIEGLRSRDGQTVKLTTVDKSDNRSEPLTVSIEPGLAPIDLLFQSLEIKPTFGGTLISFNNESNSRIEVQLFKEEVVDNKTVDVYQQSAFLQNSEITNHIFRGFDAVESKFKILAIDRWDNVSDTLSSMITPFVEVQLDETKFARSILPTDGQILECCGGNFFVDQLWNANDNVFWPNVFHTNDVAADPIPVLPPYTEPNLIAFTIDLGQEANLSRVKIFPRIDGGPYNRGNPRLFEVWGVKEIPADNGASFNGWSLLVKDGEIIKPSGAPLGQRSAEDDAAAEAGHDISTDPEPTVRYVRFITLKNWEGTQWVHMGEIEFFGKPVE